MKRVRNIVLLAVAFYALVLAVAWSAATSLAHRKTVETLKQARTVFARVTDDTVDSVLWYSSVLLLDELGKTLVAPSVSEMQALAKQHHLDEVNIVDRTGRVVASNFADEIGNDFASNAVTAVFLEVLDPKNTPARYAQPYRPSISHPDASYKYYVRAFPDRSGFLQLGFTQRHLIRSFENTPTSDCREWTIGRYGHFEVVDDNGDGFVDPHTEADGFEADGGLLGERCGERGAREFTYTFCYLGLKFRAVLPEVEFHQQRNLFISIGAVALGLIIVFLTVFLAKLSASSAKLEALHRERDARMAADLSLARVIQLSSLTRTDRFRPLRLDCTFDAVTYPAREVGGDFYDTFELPDGRIAFLVGDVSGKGVPAAMFMLVSANAAYSAFHARTSAAEAVAEINAYLCEHNEAEMFVTAWFGVLDPKTGAVEYVNAGHVRPYVVRTDGRVERVEGRGGLFLGMFPEAVYSVGRLALGSGDRLFLFTDGVTEAMDAAAHAYGERRLVERLSAASADLCASVKADVDAFVGGAEHSDDLTMLSLVWYGELPCAERIFPVAAPSQSETLAFVRAEAKLADAKQRARLLNAVDELVANVIGHSGAKHLTVTVENVPGRCRVMLVDDGEAFNPLACPEPDTQAGLEDRPEGGLGILIARRLVTSSAYRREAGRNFLVLVQRDA